MMQGLWVTGFVLLALAFYEFFGLHSVAGAIEIAFLACQYIWIEVIALRVVHKSGWTPSTLVDGESV
jgi:hypothetical protein